MSDFKRSRKTEPGMKVSPLETAYVYHTFYRNRNQSQKAEILSGLYILPKDIT